MNLPKVEEKPETKMVEPVVQIDRMAQEYDDAVLDVGVRLENADLLKYVPSSCQA